METVKISRNQHASWLTRATSVDLINTFLRLRTTFKANTTQLSKPNHLKMSNRLLDPQTLLNRLLGPLKTTTSTPVKVINNNLTENKQEPQSKDEPVRPATVNRRYAEKSLSNFNAFETKVPANSPAKLFCATEVWTETSTDNRPPRPKAADPRNRLASAQIPGLVEPSTLEPPSNNFQQSLERSLSVVAQSNVHKILKPSTDKSEQQVVKKISKSSQLRSLVSESRARPKAAHPSRRQMHHQHTPQNITQVTVSSTEPKVTQEATQSEKQGRPKGAHHRNHPMYIPGLDDDSDDELEALLEATSQWIKKMKSESESKAASEQTSNKSTYTFRPGDCFCFLLTVQRKFLKAFFLCM